jgi:hypothetical protein
MSKHKKEFKRRVGKMQKHVTALIEISADEAQRESLYTIERALSWLADTAAGFYDPDGAIPPLNDEQRKDPRAVAN